MKKIVFLVFSVFLSLTASAQVFMTEVKPGAKMEYAYLDGNGKTLETITQTLISSSSVSEGTKMEIAMEMMVDGKKVSLPYSSILTSDKVIIGKEVITANSIIQQQSEVDVKVTGDDIVYPRRPKEGENLPSYKMDIIIGALGMNITTNTEVNPRKCTKKEQITVPAGTYEAYVIEETATASVKILGTTHKESTSTVSWLVPDVGIVKQISRDKNGKETGGMILNKISK